MESTSERTAFFTHDRAFYRSFFGMLVIVAMQNLVAYSVNMADNIMLGSYSQSALSGAATVNQIFFVVNQCTIALGNALVAISAQYWGKKQIWPIRTLTGIALKLGLAISTFFTILCLVIPEYLIRLFTNSDEIIAEGKVYLSVIVWTFIIYFISQILIASLRAVRIVKISFYISLISLFVNIFWNYVLIFGRLGFPEMGILGAGIGTLIGRVAELTIVVIYVLRDKTLRLFQKDLLHSNRLLWKDFSRILGPMMVSAVLWSLSVPIQTAILGHLSDDAIAANSVATTFYQYLKVIVIAQSSTSAVMIGNSIGQGKLERIKSDARTLSVIDVTIGVVLGLLLVVLKNPLLSLYNLNDNAMRLSGNLILIMALIMVGMSYQMPVGGGIIQGAGDVKFSLKLNIISTWLIVVPFSFMAAFWWKLPVEWVVVVLQSDQIFKGLPIWLHFRKYKWIRILTRDNVSQEA